MKKILFLCLFVWSLQVLAQGQDSLTATLSDPKIKYKAAAVCMNYRAVRDEGHSPLFHRGTTLQLLTYHERWRTKNNIPTCITKLEFVAGLGMLKTNKNNVSVVTSVTALNMEVNYHCMFPLRTILNGKGNCYLGGIFTNTFDGRLYTFLPNNSFGYEFSNVLNPATHINYNFSLGKNKRNYEAGFKLNVALLAHVIRPNYIGMEPQEVYSEEDIRILPLFTKGNQIALPNRFLRINTEIYLDRFYKSNKNKFRFFYGWGFHITKLPQSNALYSFQHTLGVVRMLYSEKPKKVRKK